MKVAILGKLESKFQAPFDDKDYQIWGCNVHQDFNKIPRYDLWFDIHRRPSNYKNIPENKMVTFNTYPFDDVVNLLGGIYFNNSISYMIAYAILHNAKEISLYGCKFIADHEQRTQQKNNVRELLFFAKGKGINVFSYDGLLKEYNGLYR